MKQTVRNISLGAALLSGLLTAACDDFFETDPDNIINVSDYIETEDEMYRGFLGIITCLQEAGDQAIFLTDTRCNYLEIAANAPVALQNIYNYEPTDGNEYADPTCYYKIITACNDYFDKMAEYHARLGSSMSEQAAADFPKLISSAVRLKVWAYYTLGRIYGKAMWFDDPLEELKDLNDASVFTPLNDMGAIADKCIELLDNGIEVDGTTYAADLDMDWPSWIDPETGGSAYDYWNYITPPWMILRAELLSWRCSYNDNSADWLWIRDTILQYLYDIYTNADGSIDEDSKTPDYYYACTIPLMHTYYTIFFSEQVGNDYQLIAGIMYDYANQQRNRIVQYFCPSYPGDGFYLQPSEYGISLYGETDMRGLTQQLNMTYINNQVAFTKYFYSRQTGHNYTYLRSKIFEIEPTIILFRGHDYHFLLAEAENHLGNWRQAKTLLNNGLENEFANGRVDGVPVDEGWSELYNVWFGSSGGYGDVGIVGCVMGTEYDLPTPDDDDYSLTEEERIRLYDLALADEYLKEYTGEGKSYSYLCKMAARYNDPDIVADRVAPKYPEGMQGKVRGSIETNYFIDWDLTGE
ncbi:MAG: hypothetical protein LUI04_02320 [Porphyromonadaceae bacterium]|nr:hypothetical protein [Porphyromonadaceae bacterium]